VPETPDLCRQVRYLRNPPAPKMNAPEGGVAIQEDWPFFLNATTRPRIQSGEA
jgi:hypothetical protein